MNTGISKLVAYALSLPSKVIDKNDLVESIDGMYSDISNDIRPMVDMVLAKLAKRKDKVSLADIPTLKGTVLASGYGDILTLVKGIDKTLSMFESNSSNIDKYIKAMPKNISTVAITTNQALLLNVLENMYMFTRVTPDILILVLEKLSNSTSVYSTGILKEKRNVLYDYNGILSEYNTISNILVDLNNIVIDEHTPIESILASKTLYVPSKLPAVAGFTSNPIYMIRIWLVDRDIANIKIMKAKKEYLQLLLAEMELKESDSHSDEVSQSIETAKDMINDYEMKIEKLSK